MDSKKRQSGWYMVRCKKSWQIACWEANSWSLVGVPGIFKDAEFDQISPRPVITMDEMKAHPEDETIIPKTCKGGRKKKHF